MEPKDLRKHARRTKLRLVLGFVILLFLVGDGLIYLIYGRESALLGLVCLLGAVIPVVLIWLVLNGFEWIVKRMENNG